MTAEHQRERYERAELALAQVLAAFPERGFGIFSDARKAAFAHWKDLARSYGRRLDDKGAAALLGRAVALVVHRNFPELGLDALVVGKKLAAKVRRMGWQETRELDPEKAAEVLVQRAITLAGGPGDVFGYRAKRRNRLRLSGVP